MKTEKILFRVLVVVLLLLVAILLIRIWINYCDHYIERHLDKGDFLTETKRNASCQPVASATRWLLAGRES